MKVTIENYQAIKKAELDFLPGVTAIIGPTNNGKSSIIRAIKGAVNNQGGNGFINYDADEATVNITYDNHNIKWNKHKKAGKSYYEVDGNVLNKIGQTQVKEVADIMNMNEIEVGNERFQINFWKQMDKPFLVDKTPYQLFDFISKSKEQELVATLQANTETKYKDLNKDILSLNAKANLVTETMAGLNSEIEAMNKLSSVDLTVLTKVLQLYNKVSRLSQDINAADENLQKYNDLLETHAKRFYALSSIMLSMENSLDAVSKANKIVSSLEQVDARLNNATEVLNTSIEQSTRLSNEITEVSNKRDKLHTILDDISQLNGDIAEITKLKNSIASTDRSILNLEHNLKLTERSIQESTEALAQFAVCPLCEKPLDKEGGHLHG